MSGGPLQVVPDVDHHQEEEDKDKTEVAPPGESEFEKKLRQANMEESMSLSPRDHTLHIPRQPSLGIQQGPPIQRVNQDAQLLNSQQVMQHIHLLQLLQQ